MSGSVQQIPMINTFPRWSKFARNIPPNCRWASKQASPQCFCCVDMHFAIRKIQMVIFKLNFLAPAFLFQEERVGNVNVKCTFQLLAAGEQREGTNGQNSAKEKKMNLWDRNPDLDLLNVIPHVCHTLFLHPDQHSRWIYLLSLNIYNSSATRIKLIYTNILLVYLNDFSTAGALEVVRLGGQVEISRGQVEISWWAS